MRVSIRHRGPAVALGLFIAAYFAVSFYLSYLRFLEFSTSNWDFGVFQQMFWATLHGHPMYESGDWELYGNTSFLEVHPAFVTYLLLPFYAVYPSPYTLFALQSAGACLAAGPLYGIGLKVLRRPWWAAGIAGLYLVSAPLLLANLFDFHLELFLPLEIFSLFLCGLTGRYRWGLLVAGIAMITLEVMPFFVAFIALYFLLPSLRRMGAFARAHAAQLGSAPGALGREIVRATRQRLRDPTARWAAGLLVFAVVAYPVLRILEWYIVPALLPPPPNPSFGQALTAAQASGLGLAISGALATSITTKLEFWVILVALIGFLPLLAPRELLIVLPWFVFTLQAPQLDWTLLGFHYDAVPLGPLFIAAVFGLERLDRAIVPWFAERVRRFRSSRGGAPGALARPRPARSRPLAAAAALGVAVLVAANLLVGPMDPINQRLDGSLPGYNVKYDVPPGFSNVQQIASLVPPNAYVLTSANLFPLVANDLNAYALLWTPNYPPQLAFGAGHPPEYLFLSSEQSYAIPAWLATDLDHHVFGLRGEVEVSPVGVVTLLEIGYSGPPTVLDAT